MFSLIYIAVTSTESSSVTRAVTSCFFSASYLAIRSPGKLRSNEFLLMLKLNSNLTVFLFVCFFNYCFVSRVII